MYAMKETSDKITHQIRMLLEDIKALRCMSDSLRLRESGSLVPSASNKARPIALVGPAYDYLEKKVSQKQENQNQKEI